MTFISQILLVILVLFNFVNAQTGNTDPLEVRPFLSPAELKPHQPAKLILQLQLPQGYHAYYDQFSLKLDANSGFQLGEWKLSPLKKWFDKFSKKEREGVEGKSEFIAEVIAPENFNTDTLSFELTYQACSETFCLFPTTKKLEVSYKTKELNQMPSGFSGFDLEKLFKEKVKDSILMALLITFLAGFLTSLSPCVYPMIPITVAVLSHGAEKRSRLSQFTFSIFYVLGIATTFSILGLAAAQFGFLFGSLLSNSWVLGLISLILFAMGLSLLGFFEIHPPAKLMNIAAGRGGSGRQGAFVSGLFFGIVASPCVGPVLVAILAWVSSTQNPFLGFILLFTYALGLGVLFMFLGLFSKSLPKSGRWMNTVKKFMGILVLLVSAYYGHLIYEQYRASNNSTFDETQIGKSPLPWEPLTQDFLEKSKGQPIMVDFWAVWCAACHELEQNTFSDPRVQEHLKSFRLLKYDATKVTPETRAWMEKFSIRGLPAVLFFSSDGVWLENLTLSEYENAERFLDRLDKVKNHVTSPPQ